MFGASSEPASVKELGFQRAVFVVFSVILTGSSSERFYGEKRKAQFERITRTDWHLASDYKTSVDVYTPSEDIGYKMTNI